LLTTLFKFATAGAMTERQTDIRQQSYYISHAMQ